MSAIHGKGATASLLKSLFLLVFVLSLAACGGGGGGGAAAENPDTTTYTINGSVSGLTGTLVLQSNGSGELTLTSDGDFTFTTAVAQGSSYHITVRSQPNGQVCALRNGTGPSEERIHDISIICGVPHSIGGTVSGLTGTLVLQNNGGDELSLTQNGTYTFPTQMPLTAEYRIEVVTQPAGQECYVSNYRDTVEANVTNINVTCTNYFTIGGTVSGLNGYLQLNVNGSYGGYAEQDGAFTLNSLVTGSSYYVSISSSPSTQRCTLTNGSGTATSNVTNISVSCVNLPYYDISGTVSGLSGTVVLQNNGGNNVTLNGNGNFTFANQIIEGGSYRVSVSSQPSGQVCTVSNGVNTVTSTVTNVSVVCGTPYNLSGTVTGLNGTLVLQNNRSDNLTLTSNSSFTFATQVAGGSSYDVRVLSDPGTQQCSVSNASGTVSGNISNVQISCTPLITRTGKLGEGIPLDAAIQGGYAFVAAYGGLLVLDVSNPANPSSVTFYETSKPVSRVVLSGTYAYVVGFNNLSIIDISNPATPVVVGSAVDYIGRVDDLVVSGNYAYVIGDSSLRIFDISNPVSPAATGTYSGSGWFYGVAVSGNYAYIADYLNGLHVIDISDHANLSEVNLVSLSNPNKVTVSGDYAYVAASSGGLFILDISNPATPVLAGSLSVRAEDVAVSGTYAYLATLSNGLAVIDVSNPAVPTQVGSYRDVPGWSGSVVVSGDTAYVLPSRSVGSDVTIINISTPTLPTLSGVYAVNQGYLADAENMAVTDGYAYFATRSGLTVASISDPAAPSYITSYLSSNGNYDDVVISAGYAFAAHSSGMDIINISNPAAPTLTGRLYGTGWLYDLVVRGNYVYAADALNGLRIFDISDLANPVDVSLFEIDNPQQLALAGGYAYVISSGGELQIVDISNPLAPSAAGTIPFINYANFVEVSGDFAYIITSNGLRILDISNPAVPTEIGSINKYGERLVKSGNYIYIASSTDLIIVDVSDPANSVEVVTQPTLGSARAISVVGDRVYVAEYGYGLEVFQTFLP